MAYVPERDKVLAEEITEDGKITIALMSYDDGPAKIAFKDSKGFPMKRLPMSHWSEIKKLMEALEEKLLE